MCVFWLIKDKKKTICLTDGLLISVSSIVVEIALNIDNGSALVAAAGGQVTQRTDQVSKSAGGSTLGDHLAYKVAVLLDNLTLDGIAKLLAGERSKLIVSKIFQLQLIGGTLKANGVSRRNNRVSQLPNLTDRILECAIAINHDFKRSSEALLVPRRPYFSL